MSSNDKTNFDIILEKYTYGGDAMGRLPDGRAAFVPFGLVGERVRVKLTEEKKNFARGEILQILQFSGERIQPRCKHFGECGGCHYQHIPYEKQLEIKTEILRDQLTRIGKIENPPVQPIVACPNPWNYRNHIQFSLDKNGKLGFVGASLRLAPTVIEISECHLPEPSINDFWRQLEFEPETNVERVSLRAGNDEELMLILESDSPQPPEIEIEAGISVAHVYQDNTVVVAGNDHIFIRVLDRDFKVSASSFFQVNTLMAEKMVEHLFTCLPVSLSTTLLDLYCGVGLFSAFFAPKCGRVIGVESSASACEDFAVNLDEFDNVELYEGAAEEVLPSLVGQIANLSFVIVDPPRAGIERHALDAIVQLKPQRIAYVSCDPSTMARDAARLIAGGYKLSAVTPFDMFPQTFHIESVSLFER
ncbi:MAG: 23S rRNA (uracil(1939)-C(5))-methyltransferase RlmD [Anaerolineae bacterium]|nr:MAG: 23S rRNA (uracil(1939)-C(5))-methyltransferase RlmD [Anaerolineae bacterium]WKZ44491.1 MAG: class I SAM-dependent RNA methyltransferase [Anaerolineales bacterium]